MDATSAAARPLNSAGAIPSPNLGDVSPAASPAQMSRRVAIAGLGRMRKKAPVALDKDCAVDYSLFAVFMVSLLLILIKDADFSSPTDSTLRPSLQVAPAAMARSTSKASKVLRGKVKGCRDH